MTVLERRSVLALGAAGVAATAVITRWPTRSGAPSEEPATAPSVPLGDLVGLELEVEGRGTYVVLAVGALARGGVPVVLATPSGASFQVDVLRADPSAPHEGLGVEGRYVVSLRNGGDGRTPTDEVRGLGAMALASALTGHAAPLPPDLLTLGERAALDPRRVDLAQA